MPGPLASLKILDFSTLLPGPFASMLLADLGADVIHVEAPHRPDMTRLAPPFDGTLSVWHAMLNRSKKSLALDLKAPGATEVVRRLVASYDIVLEQFRPGVMDRLGVGYETLRSVNPRLIYCAITGYGQTGPYRDRAGHDINYLALSGAADLTGRAAARPLPLPLQVADIGGGSYNAVMGILAAVIHRQVSGEGQQIDVSMFDGAVSWNGINAAHYLAGNSVPERESLRLAGGSFYDYYRTADDRYLAVGGLEPKFMAGFCTALGRPDLLTPLGAISSDVQLAAKREIERIIAGRPLADWMALFAPLDVCVEPVLTIPEMVDHPLTAARELLVEVEKLEGGTQRQVANPLKFSATTPSYKHAGAPLGAHTVEILRAAGFDEAEIAALRAAGVLGA